MHYERDVLSPSGFTSAIHSPEFFLAESGSTDPDGELRATLAAMLQPLSGNPNAHAKCRFPARLMWLRKHFPEHAAALGDVTCPAFAEWAPMTEIKSVSLVFANGYLGNPASYYGHIFIKFNRHDSASAHLLDQTANYGAIDTSGDNPFSYIVKGVAGGYDGGFSPVDFFFHEAMYNENELRDLWEYRLNLSPEEIQYIASHTWEVMHKRYTYYFFHDNCAYRVAELLEIVNGIEAYPRGRPWIVPQAVLKQISESKHRGQPLVERRIFHPSRQTRLYHRFSTLNSEQRDLVSGLIEKRISFDGGELQELARNDQHAVIDTVIDYYQFKDGKVARKAGGKLSPDYVEALSARLRQPPGTAVGTIDEQTAPDSANAPSWVQAGISYRKSQGTTQTFRMRPAYYDALDVSGAQAKNGGLSMGELFLEADDRKLRILRFDLLSIDSMNPAVTNLPGDRGFGWRLRAGVEQEHLDCTQCLVARTQGDYTWGSWIGSPKVFGALYVGGALQERTKRDGLGFARIGISIVSRPSVDFGVRFSQEVRRPIDSDATPFSVAAFEIRKALGNNYDLRALWERDHMSRLTVGIGHYW